MALLIGVLSLVTSYTPMPPSPMEVAVAEIIAGETMATATAPAERTGNSVQETPTQPPPPTAPPTPTFSGDSYNGRCVGAEPLLAFYSPGWDVARMSRIMYRESRCQPGVTSSTGCCRGLLQIHQLHVPSLGGCGVHSRSDLFDPVKNVCSAAIVWTKAGGYSPWAL